MKLGYARVSKADGSQTLDLQMDALVAAGVSPDQIYSDEASGKRDDRPGLEACLKAFRSGDTLWVGRPGGVILHGSSIARNVTGSVSGRISVEFPLRPDGRVGGQ